FGQPAAQPVATRPGWSERGPRRFDPEIRLLTSALSIITGDKAYGWQGLTLHSNSKRAARGLAKWMIGVRIPRKPPEPFPRDPARARDRCQGCNAMKVSSMPSQLTRPCSSMVRIVEPATHRN